MARNGSKAITFCDAFGIRANTSIANLSRIGAVHQRPRDAFARRIRRLVLVDELTEDSRRGHDQQQSQARHNELSDLIGHVLSERGYHRVRSRRKTCRRYVSGVFLTVDRDGLCAAVNRTAGFGGFRW